jgi:hypothetical protein
VGWNKVMLEEKKKRKLSLQEKSLLKTENVQKVAICH